MLLKTPQSTRGDWLRPLLGAALLVTLTVTVLLALGRRRAEPDAVDTGASPGQGSPAQGLGQPDGTQTPATPRHTLPASAWAVVDLDLEQLAEVRGTLPEALGQLDCQQVDPPHHVAIALLAPGQRDDLEFLMSATEASDAFRACARQRMLESAGTRVESWPSGVEVLSRTGGLRLVLRPGDGLVVFVNAPSLDSSALVELLGGKAPNAAEHGPHPALARALGPHAGLSLTISLPAGWIDELVTPEEAGRSPLRFLRASAWSLRPGGLYGVIECADSPDDAGCASLARFVEAARDDGLAALPPEERTSLRDGFALEAAGPGRLELNWHLPPQTRARLLAGLLRGQSRQ